MTPNAALWVNAHNSVSLSTLTHLYLL